MCGRYTLTVSKTKIAQEFKLQDAHLKETVPSYNISPSGQVLGVLEDEAGRRLNLFRWGFIPSWTKPDVPVAGIINARKETIAEKVSFRNAFQNRRCLIPADGFYEWKQEGKRKTPYFIRLKNRSLFCFAGIWSDWINPGGVTISTCAIITGDSNELMKPIHQRMPVILPKEQREEWLNSANHDTKTLLDLLNPYPAGEMEAYPVSHFVNSPGNNTPECIKPLTGS